MRSLRAALCLLTACSFTVNGGAGDDMVDAPPGSQTIELDSTEELRGTPPAARLTESMISTQPGGTKPGTVEPALYATGLVRADGQQAVAFLDVSVTRDWTAAYAAATITGVNLVSFDRLDDFGDSRPPNGFGLTNKNDFTIYFQGELFFEDGEQALALTGTSEEGFIEILSANGSVIATAFCHAGTCSPGMFTITGDGWYRFRAAWTDSGGASQFTLRHAPGAGGTLATIAPWRVRTRIDDLTGVLVSGFGDRYLSAPITNAHAISRTTPFMESWSTAALSRTGVNIAGGMTVRNAGQVRITETGMYSFGVDTSGKYRLWVDGVRLDTPGTDGWSTAAPGSAMLSIGWHDVELEGFVTSATGHVNLTMGLAGAALAPIDPARTRPSTGARGRAYAFGRATDINLIANGQLALAVAFAPIAPTDAATLTHVDVMYVVKPADWGLLAVQLESPSGAIFPLFDDPATTRTGTNTMYHRVDAAALGPNEKPLGQWILRFSYGGNVGGGDKVFSVSFVMHYQGGRPAVPALARYESPVIDLRTVLTPTMMTSPGTTETGAGLATFARMCRDITEASCGVYAPASGLSTAGGGAFVQLRADLTSDGTAMAIVDALSVLLVP